MDIDRRSFLIAACAFALSPLLAGPKRVVSSAAVAAPAFRPDSAGSSAGVCAHCGASDHHMLSPQCPGRPEVYALRFDTEREAAV